MSAFGKILKARQATRRLKKAAAVYEVVNDGLDALESLEVVRDSFEDARETFDEENEEDLLDKMLAELDRRS